MSSNAMICIMDETDLQSYKNLLDSLANDGAIRLSNGKVTYFGPAGLKETLEEADI